MSATRPSRFQAIRHRTLERSGTRCAAMSGFPGDENPNPQWQRPSRSSRSWQSQWQQGSPLGDRGRAAAAGAASGSSAANPQWQAPAPPTPGKAVAALILEHRRARPLPATSSRCSRWSSATRRAARSTAPAARLGGAGSRSPGSSSAGSAIAIWTLFIVARRRALSDDRRALRERVGPRRARRAATTSSAAGAATPGAGERRVSSISAPATISSAATTTQTAL